MQTIERFQPSAAGPSPVQTEACPRLQLAGASTAWKKLLHQAEMIAPYVQVAAIEGKHGSGKYTLARFLHRRSPLAHLPLRRRDAREWLATDGDAGLINGVLYLDRVDLLASNGQEVLAGVLRGLQDRPPRSAVVLASSQVPLHQMAAEGLLLPDLAFRLTATQFTVPPLRQRREDIMPIAQALLERFCAQYRLRPVVLGQGALTRLLRYEWPGNIRELSSVLEKALLEAEDGMILAKDLALRAVVEVQPAKTEARSPEDLSLDSIIRRHVEYVVHLNHGNKVRAARQLAVSRSTLYRILGHESAALHQGTVV